MKNGLTIFFYVFIAVALYAFAREFHYLKRKVEGLENRMVLQPHHYIITLQDSFWVEVRRSDSSLVGQVWCDTTTQIGKLFYNDNK